jgi:F-type H+-transporting ATPase subunit b
MLAQEHAAEAAGTHSLSDMVVALAWPLANFAIFLGVLYYFLNAPLRQHLSDRHAAIRKDLVEAAQLKATATSQLAEIERRLQTLPAELDQLRTRGSAEIAAEEQRIAAAAQLERERLLEQTRREIDLQVRLAKRDLLEHAADLSVQLATERLKKDMTDEDHTRLVNRYVQQVKGQQA